MTDLSNPQPIATAETRIRTTLANASLLSDDDVADLLSEARELLEAPELLADPAHMDLLVEAEEWFNEEGRADRALQLLTQIFLPEA